MDRSFENRFFLGMGLILLFAGCRHTRSRPEGEPVARVPVVATQSANDSRSADQSPPEDSAPPIPVRAPNECAGRPVVNIEEKSPQGELLRIQQVVKGDDGSDIPHGLNTLYFPTGQKKLEVSYECGVAHGLRVAWYEDGKLRSKGENANGKNHGVWTVWFPDGSKSQEFTMDHGAWRGTYTTWHSSGQKQMQVEYVNGLQQGPLQMWDANGVLLQSVDQVDGVPQPMPGGRTAG